MRVPVGTGRTLPPEAQRRQTPAGLSVPLTPIAIAFVQRGINKEIPFTIFIKYELSFTGETAAHYPGKALRPSQISNPYLLFFHGHFRAQAQIRPAMFSVPHTALICSFLFFPIGRKRESAFHAFPSAVSFCCFMAQPSYLAARSCAVTAFSPSAEHV